MTTPSLFDAIAERYGFPLTARARVRDVATSHLAAQAHDASGATASHCAIVYDVVRTMPGLTFRQIAARCLLDPVECMRRLGDLANKGLVRKGPPQRVNGRQSHTWSAT